MFSHTHQESCKRPPTMTAKPLFSTTCPFVVNMQIMSCILTMVTNNITLYIACRKWASNTWPLLGKQYCGSRKLCWEDWVAVSIKHPCVCTCVHTHVGILHRPMKTRNKQWSFGYYSILSLELWKVKLHKTPKATISTHYSSLLSNKQNEFWHTS